MLISLRALGQRPKSPLPTGLRGAVERKVQGSGSAIGQLGPVSDNP